MIDSELGLTIVFNGCIYNFRALRCELERRGYRFFSDGDTELIIKAYHAWGMDCVKRFNGMFAFVIWEHASGCVILARDRLGIKPLYLADVAGGLRFASTLPALLAAGGVDTDIDPRALHHYMSFHGTVPAPLTILKGVRKLSPATVLIVEPDGRRCEHAYWDLRAGTDYGPDIEEWRAALCSALKNAVESRRVSDVPIGVLLSGGLDSSLMVALLAESGQNTIETFSVGFDSLGDIAGDEFQYSDLIARQFGTQHHRIEVDSSRALSAIPGVVSAMSEPMMSHDAIGFYLLSEEVSKHVKVVLSGQGADEIFGGYHWYRQLLNANDGVSEYARVYFDRDHEEMGAALAPCLVDEDVSRNFVEEFFSQSGTARPIDQALLLDTQIMLVDDPVKRVDNMTMAFGLEARVPFLDHKLVELAAQMPAEIKVRNGGKHILKEAARGFIPDEIIDRPKGYFPVPALKYLRGPYLTFARDVLNQPAACERELFRRDYVERLLKDPEGQLTPKGHSKLWQLTLLECWLQTHV